MEPTTFKNIKLGSFVLTGLLLLVLLLYLIGRNLSMFGNGYQLKARFVNIQGVVIGNNVRFSGIQIGTVKRIDIINDTTIEITMVISPKMSRIIKKNAIVSIATDGLVGDKLVNINPSKETDYFAIEGDILLSKKPINTDEVLNTLSKTNNDIADIAANLKITIQRINASSAIWGVLNDKYLHKNISQSILNIKNASAKATDIMSSLDTIITDVKHGKGTAGEILRDNAISNGLKQTVGQMNDLSIKVDSFVVDVNRVVKDLSHDIAFGNGPALALLRDSLLTIKLNASINNLANGTNKFNENMEALKHNFLFRGYFRKIERDAKKENHKK